MTRLATTLALALVLPLAACSTGQRPIDRVIVSGDEAYQRSNYSRAANEYKEWVDRYPANADARFKLGRTLLAIGEPEAAADNLQVAYDLRPDREEYLDTLAQALVEARRNDDLFRVLEERVVNRGDVEDHLRLARFSLRAGDVDRADQALRTAGRLAAPDDLRVHLARAAFAREIGDDDDEIASLRRVLAIEPGHQFAANRLRELGIIPGPTLAVEPDG